MQADGYLTTQVKTNIEVKILPHVVLSTRADLHLLAKFAKGVVFSAAHLFSLPLLHFILQLEPSCRAAINNLLLSNRQTMRVTNQLLSSSSSSTFPLPPHHFPPPGNEPQAEAQIERVSTLSMVRRDTALLLRDFRQGASNWIHSLLDSNRAPPSAGTAAEPPPGSTGTSLLPHNAHTSHSVFASGCD